MKEILITSFRYLYGIFVGGLLVQQFYIWFLQPVFTNVPNINYWQAIGLSMFLYLFNQIKVYDIVVAKQYEKDDLVIYGSYILPWIVLGMGFITHLIIK